MFTTPLESVHFTRLVITVIKKNKNCERPIVAGRIVVPVRRMDALVLSMHSAPSSGYQRSA